MLFGVYVDVDFFNVEFRKFIMNMVIVMFCVINESLYLIIGVGWLMFGNCILFSFGVLFVLMLVIVGVLYE